MEINLSPNTKQNMTDNLDFVISKNPIYCLNLKELDQYKLSYFLNHLISYEEPSFIHYHYNSVDNEKMLMISEDAYTNYKNIFTDQRYDDRSYINIQLINTSMYLTDIGLVSKISKIFAESEIPILYITTLQNNFILVEKSFYDRTLELLKTFSTNIHIE
jgi:hypothetical protein